MSNYKELLKMVQTGKQQEQKPAERKISTGYIQDMLVRDSQSPVKAAPKVTVEDIQREAKAAAGTHDAYMKSQERKSKVDEATNEILKKVFGNLGQGNVDLQLQNAPGKILEHKNQEQEKELKARKDYAEGQENAVKNIQVTQNNMDDLEKWPEEDRQALQLYAINRNRDLNAPLEMTSSPFYKTAEKESSALIAKYGKQKVDALAESFMRRENQTAAEEITKAAQEGADGFWGGIGHSAASVAANLIGSGTGPLGYLQEAALRTGQYTTLDPNNAGQLPSVYAGAVRQQVAENIEGDGSIGGKVGATLYKAGMGAADTGARAILGGGSKLLSLAMAAGNSFGNTVSQASRQGANPAQALALGAVNAGIEVATEFIPLDELLKTAKNGSKGAAAVIGNVLKQAGIEATTEEISLIGTTLAEMAILREKSGYEQQIQEAIAQGASYAEAKAMADKALMAEAGETAIVSALSGAMSTAGAEVSARAPDKLQETASWMADAMHQAVRKNHGQDVQNPDGANKNTIPEDGAKKHIQNPTYEELTGKDDIPIVNVGRNTEGKSYAQLKTEAMAKATNEKWFDAPHTNTDTGMPIFLTNKTFTHAFSNLRSDFGTDTILAMNHLPELIRDAVLTNVADPKNPNKPESKVYTFLAAINGENGTEPVKLTVKEYDSNSDSPLPKNILEYFKRNKASQTNNRLYDVKALEVVGIERAEAEKESGASAIVADGQKPSANSTPNSTIRIADLVGLVKGDAQKYIPKRTEMGSTPMVDTSEPSARGGQHKGSGMPEDFEAMGAASAGFSPFSHMQYEYGNIPDGENPVRPDDMPLSTNGTDRVSYTARTVKGAEVTPESFIGELEDLVVKGGMSYIPIHNDEVAQRAAQRIKEVGWESARINWSANVRAGKTGANMTATGALLLNNAANAGDKQAWLEILDDYRKLGTKTAQGLQAFRILKKLAPDDQLYMIDRSISQMVEDMHLDTKITIDKELRKAYRKAETQEARDQALEAIQQNVADQIPSTALDKWTALRYLNMLGNFRTQVRNITGNIGAKVTYLAKDEIAATLEAVASKVSGGKFQRTKVHKVSKALKKAAAADFDNYQDAVLDGGKFSDGNSESAEFAKGVQEKRRIFKSKVLEGYRRGTNWAMNQGDIVFAKSAYARAMAGYLQANGVKGDSFDGVSDTLLDKAREYAVKEAQETTFRDNNMVSDWISKVGRRKDTPKAAKMVAEGIMPFRKTPANVLVRAEEFSPLGLINSAVKTVQGAKGEATGAEVINSWAKSLTGTGLFILGAALGNMGVLTGGPDPDEKEAEFDDLNGYQNYALQLPDGTNLTIDFLSPTAMPMFMGAQLAKIISDEGYSLADFEAAFTSLADPMIQMSMLQGVNDTIDNIKYADNNLGQFLLNASMSYLTQGLTNTLMGQLERSTEDSRMTTYIDKDSATPVWLQRQLGKASAKIPGWDYQQTPYIDAWGREEKNPEGAMDYLYNLLSPSYIDKAEADKVAKELYRLNEVQSDINVFPQSPEGSLTYTDKDGNRHEDYNLSMEQLDKLKRVEGQTQAKLAGDLVNSGDYQKLTDKQKAKAIALAYDYAREKGRVEAVSDYSGYSESWMEGIEGEEMQTIIQKVASAELTDAFSALTGNWKDGHEDAQSRKALESAYSVYKQLDQATQKAIRENASGRLVSYLDARAKGVKAETFIDLYKTYWEIDGSDAKTSDKAQQWAYALERAEESRKINAAQKAALKDSMVYYQMFPAETEKFDQLTESGLSAKDAQDLGYLLDGIEPQQGYKTVRDIQKAETIMGSRLSEADKIAALKIYGTEAQDKNLDEMTAMGFSTDDYVAAWKIYTDGSGEGKKARAVKEYMKRFHVSEKTARAIYEIYG